MTGKGLVGVLVYCFRLGVKNDEFCMEEMRRLVRVVMLDFGGLAVFRLGSGIV
ncbi:MAG TPA: hypothetical protein VK436_15890 [Methanocella sp.]|nr:hypothetical protein [Methanocella sp.]